MSNNTKLSIDVSVPELDTIKALLGEQATIMETLVRDNVELIAALNMVMSDGIICARLEGLQVMAILQNLIERINGEQKC